MVSCTVKTPLMTPTIPLSALQLHTTETTNRLMRDLARRFHTEREHVTLTVHQSSYDTLITQLDNGAIDYLVSSYVPVRDDIWAGAAGAGWAGHCCESS